MFILTTQPVDKTLLSDILSGAEYIIQFSVYTQLYNVRNKKLCRIHDLRYKGWTKQKSLITGILFSQFLTQKLNELENSCSYPT